MSGRRASARCSVCWSNTAFERGELLLRNECQDASAETGKVFLPLGLAADAAIFAPAGGVPPPVVFFATDQCSRPIRASLASLALAWLA